MSLRYVLTRGVSSLVTLFILSIVVFVLVRLSGDPIAIMLPTDAPPETVAAFRTKFGLDEPLAVQYGKYLAGLLRGDMGDSLRYREPALPLVAERMPATFLLGFAALALSVTLAIPTGILAAVKRGTIWERLATAIPLLGQSFPVFWIGIMLALGLGVHLKWLPVSGYGSFKHLILPAVTLGIYFTARMSRLVTGTMVESISKDFIRTARAKGLPEWKVILKHALRNSLVSVITMIGLQMAALIGGAVVTETVFAWPGVGRLAIQAVYNRDYPLVQATVMVMAVMVVLINLTIDILYAVIDPRIKGE